MSVLLETSAGDIVIDLLTDYAPKLCENFLKLCKVKYYNFAPVYGVQKDFSFQTGDPLGPQSLASTGGSSIWGVLGGTPLFPVEYHKKLKHSERGTVSMATVKSSKDPDVSLAGSQFLITTGDNLDSLDGKAAIFGRVVEGFDTLDKINETFCDDKGYPLKDIRIRHTVVLDDPYNDPLGLVEPPESPLPSKAQLDTVRIGDDEDLDPSEDPDVAEKRRRENEARAQALTLEIVGDLPFAEVRPPENVLFVCKLNPVTDEEALNLIFGRFGKILSCEVIRDKRTGDSLQYAFIEYENQKDCEMAYFKMQGVLIDDHRIHVDFSQSVSKLSKSWRDDTNAKRASAARRGFGGEISLEKKRQYRDGREDRRERYRMVFDERDIKSRRRSESPETDDRKNSLKDGRTDRDAYRDGRNRDRPRDRDRFRDERQDRNRGHNRGRDNRDDRRRY